MSASEHVSEQQLQMFHTLSADDLSYLAEMSNRLPERGDAGFSIQTYDAANPVRGKMSRASNAFMVANESGEQVQQVPVTPGEISRYIDANAEELQNLGAHLGSWTPRTPHPMTGRRSNYMDVSVAYPRNEAGLVAAVNAGRANKQLAIAELGETGEPVRTIEL